MIVIREANLLDAERIAQISTDSLGYPTEPELTARRLTELNAGREKVFVAEMNDLVVGFVHAEKYQLLYSNDIVNILGLAVDDRYQKMGAGRQLVNAVEEWTREIHFPAVRVNSGAARLDAHAFYEHLGYRNTKAQKRFLKEII